MQPQLDYPGMPRYTEALAGWLAAALAGAPLDLRAQTAGWDAGGWAALRWAIQVHGAAPLLHRALAPAAAALPPGLRAYLAEQHQLSGQRVALLLGELGALLDACRAAEVEVLALKGSLLATGYYAEPGLRPMSDLDLLVRPADEARLLAVLAGLGYQPRERHWKHLTLALPAGSGPVVYWHGDHPDNPRSLDLHTRLHERFLSLAYDLTDDAWAGSAPSLLLGRPARVLAPATLLHHLAIHATSDITDRRLRLLHLHDIALVARALSHADWQALVAGARRRRGERMIYPALLLAARPCWPRCAAACRPRCCSSSMPAAPMSARSATRRRCVLPITCAGSGRAGSRPPRYATSSSPTLASSRRVSRSWRGRGCCRWPTCAMAPRWAAGRYGACWAGRATSWRICAWAQRSRATRRPSACFRPTEPCRLC